MKYLPFYKRVLGRENEEEVFDFLIANLKPSNILWSYFVNWEKVFDQTRPLEIALNTLNYLVGKDNFDDEFRFLFARNPGVAKAIPALVVRDGKNTASFEILVDYQNKKLVYENYDFSIENPSAEEIERYLQFVEKTGLKDLIANKKVKSLVDYVIGVEAGLDSNARKNRSGDVMEQIVEVFVRDVCEKYDFKYLSQADARKIRHELGYDVPVDKTARRYDFVVDNGKELFIIEANFYGGGGSKLKSTAGEYRNLFDTLNGEYKFCWITDGKGWEATQNPLREAFHHNDYLFNLAMIEKGVLEFLFCDSVA